MPESEGSEALAPSSNQYMRALLNSDSNSDTEQEDLGPRAKLVSSAHAHHAPHENDSDWKVVRNIVAETLPTLLFTTIGLVFTGGLLERVTEWDVFQRVDDLIILVPMLNNLKGNLEMNFSARLSTAANIGELDHAGMRRAMVLGNLNLLQVQALVVSAFAAALSFALGSAFGRPDENALLRRVPRPGSPGNRRNPSGLQEFVFVLVTSQIAAFATGLLLGVFLAVLIIVCRRYKVDPDNIAPPVAACLGDLLMLVLLAGVGTTLLGALNTVAPILLIFILFGVLVVAIALAQRNPHVRSLLGAGWSPLVFAMVVSSGAGMLLDFYVERYEGFGVLAIVTGGLPGAVGAVFVSRLSTALHTHDQPGTILAPHALASARPRIVALSLFGVSLPITISFVMFLQFAGWTQLPTVFVILFIFVFALAVAGSLALAHGLTLFLWRRQHDPDTYALPIHSALVDALSQVLLVGCYIAARALGADVSNQRDQ